MKTGSLATKLMLAALLLTVLVYFGVSAASYFMDPFTTTLVYDYTSENAVSVSGYVVRQEEILTGGSGDLVYFSRGEGEKVSKGGTVALVYQSAQALQDANTLRSLEEQLDQWFGDPPLWCQWSLLGGEPEGGCVTPSSPAPDSSEYPGGSSAAPVSPDSEFTSEEDAVSSTSDDYGLWNLEYSLRRDGWETPAGPGMQTSALFFHEAGTRTEQPGEGLTQNEGDYWLTYEWDGFSARYYHLASNGSETLRTIDTTRADVSTQRGIRVGDSREDVLAAYPEAKSHSDRNPSLNEENCLWIAEDLEADRGLALLFYLDGDTVRQITLTRLL